MAIVYRSDLASGGGAAEGNAVQADVRSGKTFSNSSASGLSGSMTENSGGSHKLDGSNTSYTIPEGYHPGTGSVYVETEEKTGTASASSNTVVTASSGKLMTQATVSPLSHTAYRPSSTTYEQLTAGEEKEIDLTEHHNVRYVRVKAPSASSNLQVKAASVTPQANWSDTYTQAAAVTPDSGYDGMSQVNVKVPMIRDNTLVTATGTSTPSTILNGDTSQSNSTKCLVMSPSKTGMVYTNGDLVLKPNSYLGDASSGNVLSGSTFSSSNGIQISGSMANKGAWSTTGTAGSKTYIPEGYHNGNGYVQCPSGSSPSGTKNITSNGTTSVSGYAYANVQVPASSCSHSGTKTTDQIAFIDPPGEYVTIDMGQYHGERFGRIYVSVNEEIILEEE